MDKRNLAFGRTNFILLAISAVIVIIGFILMSGSGSTMDKFEPGIFSNMRVKVAPAVCFFGFVFMIVGVMYRKKEEDEPMDLSQTKTVEGNKSEKKKI